MSEYDDSMMLSKVLQRMAAQSLHLKDKIDAGLEIPSWAEYKLYNAYSSLGSALGTAYPGMYDEEKRASLPLIGLGVAGAGLLAANTYGNYKAAKRFNSGGLKAVANPKMPMKMAAATATKTDPSKWEAAKREAKAKMGGKHSARAMQLATQIYKKKGGGYSGAKPTSQNNSLKKWTKQKWGYSGKDKPGQGGSGVYLPEKKRQSLKSTSEGRKKLRAASAAKAKATRKGEQYSSHGLAAGTSLKKSASYFAAKEAAASKDPRLARAGVSAYNQVKRTPGHPTKSHIVVAKEGDKVKTIRFGQQGVKTNQTAGQREAFKSRHRKNISRGRMSAAYWADKAKWSPKKTKDKDNPNWVKGS